MGSASVSRFADSLAELSVSCKRVPPADVAEAIRDVVEQPAVGVPLPYEGVSLEETPVETDWDATDLAAAETGVTPVGLGVADYGTVTIRLGSAGDELVAVYTDRHVAVLHADDVVADMPTAFERLAVDMDATTGSQVLATGVSATADLGGFIEGVHGPAAVDVVVVEP